LNDHGIDTINKTGLVKKLEKRLRRLQCKISKKYELNKEGRKFVKTSNIIKQKSKTDIKIIEWRNSEYESGWFDSYIDCLKYAKKHVMKVIKETEPEQVSIFG
jgi:putative transposase